VKGILRWGELKARGGWVMRVYLSYVGIRVTDLEALKFYKKVFGLEEVERVAARDTGLASLCS